MTNKYLKVAWYEGHIQKDKEINLNYIWSQVVKANIPITEVI